MTCKPASLRMLLVLAFTTASPGALPAQSDHGVLQAVPAPGAVKVDGVLAEGEWDRRGLMYVYPVKKIRQRYAVEVFAMWDRDAFYLGLHYKDPTPMINNVDAEAAPFNGWEADAFQARFTTDHGQIHMDAWYSSSKDVAVGALSYGRPMNEDGMHLSRAKGKRIEDGSGLCMAFKVDSDNRGYVQEVRIPWTLLYAKVPAIGPGLKFRFTGEYFWGGPVGLKWPAVMWSDPVNQKQPVRIVLYQNPHVWGEVELLADGAQPKGDDLSDEGGDPRRLQGPIPIRVTVPEDATRFSVVIDDAEGRRVRNLASHAEVKAYRKGAEKGKPVIEVLWDGRAEGLWDKERLRFVGDVVSPGTYTVRTLVHGGVGVVHAGSFYNPGTPPWPTADGKGAWLADHSPPRTVGVMAPESKATGRVFLTSPGVECGAPFIGLDAEGRKIWQWVRGSTHIGDADGGAEAAYFVFEYNGKPFLGKIDPNTGKQITFASGQQDVPLPGKPTGVAYGGGKVAVTLANGDQVLIFDAASGQQVKTVTVAGAADPTFAPDGALVGLAGEKVFRAEVVSGKVEAFEPAGVSKPQAVAVDSEGRLYVSDPETQTVKVYDRAGPVANLIATVGTPGGRPAGPFDPRQMAAPVSLAVEERLDGGKHLWVVEGSYHLRRIVVWDVTDLSKATVLRDYVGNTGYMGSGGGMSDNRPDLGLYGDTLYTIDYANYDYRPAEVMTGPEVEGKVRLFAPLRLAAFCSPYHFVSDVSGQPREYVVVGRPVGQVFMRRGKAWQCVAAIGSRAARIPWPEGFPKPQEGEGAFCWNDANGDGCQQPEEVSWSDAGGKDFLHAGGWGYRCDGKLNWYHSGLAVKPVRFTAEGAPLYDLAKAEPLPGELGQDPGAGRWGEAVFKTRFGYVRVARKSGGHVDRHGTVHGHIQLEGYDETGKLRWTYPTYWFSVHGAMTAPMAMPGVVMGMLKFTGIVHLDDHDVISLRGNTGQEFLIRDDGLYIGELFTDQRMAPAFLPPDERIAGVPINDTSMGGEPFSGWTARQDDGKVRLTYGYTDVRIAKVTGLDSVRELPAQKLTLGTEEIAQAKAFVPIAPGKRRTEYAIARGGPFGPGKLDLGPEPMSIRAGAEEVAQAALRYDEKNLYVAWRVSDLTPMVNKGTEPKTAFKSGDCLSVFVAPAGEYEPNALGGTRVLLTVLNGKPTAVVYRPNGPGDRPFIFESPVRRTRFQSVAVEPAVTLKVQPSKHEYVATAAIPWSALGAAPKAGLRLRGDIGVIFGRETTTHVDRIVRWVDKQTNVVNDLPTEAEFFPARWGTFSLE